MGIVRDDRVLHVKLGTIPKSIQLRWNYRTLRVGQRITFREVHIGYDRSKRRRWYSREKWQHGIIDDIRSNESRYLFISKGG